MKARVVSILIATAATTFAASVMAQAPVADKPAAEIADADRPMMKLWSLEDEAMRRTLYLALVETDVSVEFDRTPARAAFDQLREALRFPLIGRYRDDTLGFGLDPDLLITFEAKDLPALEVLEEMLSQCTVQGPECTWQIRKGFVEFGTKERLSVPAARETRTHYIADLILPIPGSPYSLGLRELNACMLMQDICESIEPGAWDFGQTPEPIDVEILVNALGQAPPSSVTQPAATRSPPDTDPRRRFEPPPRRHVPPTRIANIRYWRDVIIVHAPDYIHRQIDGYPGFRPAEKP
ncbi:MAG: hypothetical protein ACYS15_08335 [Planctomycetota bacterium]